jgi:energy-converting hydrogenase Eha subunit H
MNFFKLSGLISIICGIICCGFLLYPALVPFSLFFAIIGYTFSTINVYINAKHEITKSNFSIGYLGMILASVPVIFILVLIIRNH